MAEAAALVRARRAEVFGDQDSAPGLCLVQTKSSPTDPVSVIDTETEQFIRDRLGRLRPADAVLGEEGGGSTKHDGLASETVTWVIDPIDGTVNFLYGIESYAVSLAAQINGASVAGAVADVARGRIYSAARGSGARVIENGHATELRCSDARELSLALMGTGFGYSQRRRAAQARLLASILPSVRDVRRIGSAALDLCMVAAGRLDAYYEHGTKIWDYAAAALIAAEAGAHVVLPDPENGDAAIVVAAAPGIAQAFIALLHSAGGWVPIPA